VDATQERFHGIWKDFKDHIREYDPASFRVDCGSYYYYSDQFWEINQYIRTSRCDYICGDYRPTVYHIFVRMGG
jgi:hypothetical protein